MPLNPVRVAAGEMKPTHRVMNLRRYRIKKDETPMVMEMHEEAKIVFKKIDEKPVLLTPVTGDNMIRMIIAYGATSSETSGKVLYEMGMTEEYQSLVSEAAEVGELHSAWMTVPAAH